MIYKTLHRKLKDRAIRTSQKMGVNSDAPEGLAIKQVVQCISSFNVNGFYHNTI
jgi:hypothetical protein